VPERLEESAVTVDRRLLPDERPSVTRKIKISKPLVENNVMRVVDPLAEVDDDTTRYFHELGYDTSWDYHGEEKWYEVLEGRETVCQFDFHCPLRAFFAT
jgi:hypothetical protein